MRKLTLVLLAALPVAFVVSGCSEYKIDKRKNTPGPTGMTETSPEQFAGDALETSAGLRL